MQYSRALTVGLLAVLTAAAQAHEGPSHPPKADQVKKEQKPWGTAGDNKAGIRTIKIKMSDAMRFSPDRIEVKQGETVRFVHRNVGKVMHEFVLGTKKE